ncbi:hypothetical protein [Dyadobacter psychrotolerans]|uniref:Lipoprotein n=1 Tax=Dyadobacter psychrotolerans TaxID=2541721 RepID=A0A4R5DYY4_9BACT|nr:hypothetical protein [Dyadobacter psychrotolerans]TDE16625.1 hypothetical protein E0F88_10360 [Dyadobacter psychrotolerans]
MLNFTKLLCVFMLAGLVLSGCKDKEEVDPADTVSYDGKSYDLAKGFMLDYGQLGTGQGHNIDLYLASSEIIIHEKAGMPDSTSGKGQLIFFEMFSSVPNSLAPGTYNFDALQSAVASTFDFGETLFNANYQTGTGEIYRIVSGKVIVEKNKDIYTITFECVDYLGKPIKGFYKGALKYYDAR